MKTTITLTVLILAVLMSFTAHSQTHVYNETVNSGMWFQSSDGSEVSNPVSDAVNSSATVAQNGTDGTWQQIQYFLTYTPVSGDKLFFSIYNPNNAGPGQVQFRYSSDQSSWQFGADVTYTAATQSGWVEYSVDLSSHVGNEIDQVIIMPSGDNSAKTYIDNIYFNNESILSNPPASELTHVYNETVNSGMWFQSSDGSEVSNPVSDAVNSSATVAQNGTDGTWQQIQYFPTYTPATGDKLYFSVYDPNNVGTGQIKFEYSSNPGAWAGGGDVTYASGSDQGWKEVSLSLDASVGEEIIKVIMMPGYDTSSAVYIDNIYFGQSSIVTGGISEQVVNNAHVFFDAYGRVTFDKNQSNTEVYVYDISGRLLLRETIRGTKSSVNLRKKGIYILKIKKGNSISSKKLIFN